VFITTKTLSFVTKIVVVYFQFSFSVWFLLARLGFTLKKQLEFKFKTKLGKDFGLNLRIKMVANGTKACALLKVSIDLKVSLDLSYAPIVFLKKYLVFSCIVCCFL